jgi:hypothetical protein
MEYTKEIRKLMARPTLEYHSSYEVLTGETPDCSEFLDFDFYSWVKFRDVKGGGENALSLGRWLGVAHSVGQAMTYWILKSNGYVVARSTVRPLLKDELHAETEKEARNQFMIELKNHVADFDPDLINVDDTIIAEEPDILDDGDTEVPVEEEPGPEPLLNAEVFIPHGDSNEMAKVIGRKRDADGMYVGRKHQIPQLDSRVFVVEFPDGDQKDITYNMLMEHLYSKIDEEGNIIPIMTEIINHCKTSTAVDKSDQFRLDRKTGKQSKKKTLAGWDFEIEWRDGTTSWIPLRSLKVTNPVEVAEYVMNNKLDEEPST